MSVATSLRNASGVLPTGSAPPLFNQVTLSGWCTALLNSSLSLFTTTAGVAPGALTPYQLK